MLVKSALLTTTAIFGNTEKKQAYKYFLAQVTATKTALPEGKYIPFDWAFSEIGVNTEGVVDFGLGISDVGSTPPKSEIVCGKASSLFENCFENNSKSAFFSNSIPYTRGGSKGNLIFAEAST